MEQHWQGLLTNFEQASQTLAELESLLQTERRALIQAKPEKLDEITTQKTNLLQQLAQQQQTQAQLLHHLALDPKTPVNRFIKFAPAALKPPLEKAAQQFKMQFETCHYQHQINAPLIHISLNSTERLLNILKGKPETGQTYNAKGKVQL